MSAQLIFTVVLVLSYWTGADGADQCNADGLRQFDTNVAKLLTIGNSGRKFPENKGHELKVFCNQSYELIIEIETYKTNCLRNLPRQVAGVLIYALKNVVKQYCRKDSKRLTELIAATPCVNAANVEMMRCYTNLIDSIQGAQQAQEAKRIPHLCCEYFKLYPCFHQRTKRYQVCNAKKIESASDFVRAIVDNVVHLICGDYTENSDKCDKLESPPKKKRSQKRTKSFVVPLIELLDSFPEV